MDLHGQELRGCLLLSKAGELSPASGEIQPTPNPGPCLDPPCLQSSPSPKRTTDTLGRSPARPTAQVRSLSRRKNLQPSVLGNLGWLKSSGPNGAKKIPTKSLSSTRTGQAVTTPRPGPGLHPHACGQDPTNRKRPRRSPEPKKRPFRDRVNTSCVFDNRCEALNELALKTVQREETAGIAQPGQNRVASARVESFGPSCRGCKLCRRRAGARAMVR
jgi:hypothetical protein